jgi:hypothetical protein
LTGSCLPLSFDPKTLPASQLPARDITIRAGRRAFYESQFARFGLNFDLLPNYPDELVNPRSHVASIGAETEVIRGLVVGADYVHQHLTGIDRTVDLNAPSFFDRTAPGQVRSVAAANATRPILPVAGGVRQVNVLTNLGVADYDGLQTQISFRGNRRMYAAISYTLSKATNNSEPDGNGIGPNQSVFERQGDRPVINGTVISKSAFRGTPTSEVALFIESRIKTSERTSILLRLEGFNIFNHGNYLGRGITTYGDTGTPLPTFGQLAPVGAATNALPAFANVDPPRMFQAQARFIF